MGKQSDRKFRRTREQHYVEQHAERERERAAHHDTAKIAGLEPVTTSDLLTTVEAGHATARRR